MGKASKIARRMEKIRIKLRLRLTGETGVDGGGWIRTGHFLGNQLICNDWWVERRKASLDEPGKAKQT